MGSRHRDRSRDRSRSRGRDRDRRSRHRTKSRDRDRDRRSRSRDRRSKSKDRRRDRRSSRSSRRNHRSRSRDSRTRDTKSWDRKSRDRSRERSALKTIEEDKQQQVALLDTLTSIATSRNFSSLVSSVKEELINQNSNGSNCSGDEAPPNETEKEREERRQRRRKSRWGGSEHDKTFIPGMPTILPSTLNKEQEEAYLLQLQIEEVSRKLRSGDLGIPANIEERSPSPEPIYSSDGKRLNTREFRTRRRLEEERHALVLKMQAINPEFKPPVDYKPPIIRVNDKVMIPQEQHPEINFVGLLIGPRGNTLKTMEKETGAKIIIRGKGSVKEGKVGRKDGQPLPGEDEPLHAYITATNPEAVKKAVERIKEVIRQGVEVPENQNDLRRMQLRELAQLNGTLRENDGPRCTNCGATDHKSWLCPDKPNITNNVVCSSCGGAGHIARDCRQKRPGMGGPPQPGDRAKIDEEYMSLMAELGEGPSPDMLNSNNGALKRNVGYPNMFERAMAPRAIMGGLVRPDQQMPMQQQPQMMNNGMPPPPWGQNGPQMPCPPGMSGPGMPPNMAWGPGPTCPPGMMPPPPPPGATSPPNIPPLMPWMAGNAQPPPPGSSGTTPVMPPPPPPQVTQTAGNGAMVPPPVPWSQGPPPPPPPGIDINTFAGLPNLLAAPPPPPPSS